MALVLGASGGELLEQGDGVVVLKSVTSLVASLCERIEGAGEGEAGEDTGEGKASVGVGADEVSRTSEDVNEGDREKKHCAKVACGYGADGNSLQQHVADLPSIHYHGLESLQAGVHDSSAAELPHSQLHQGSIRAQSRCDRTHPKYSTRSCRAALERDSNPRRLRYRAEGLLRKFDIGSFCPWRTFC